MSDYTLMSLKHFTVAVATTIAVVATMAVLVVVAVVVVLSGWGYPLPPPLRLPRLRLPPLRLPTNLHPPLTLGTEISRGDLPTLGASSRAEYTPKSVLPVGCGVRSTRCMETDWQIELPRTCAGNNKRPSLY